MKKFKSKGQWLAGLAALAGIGVSGLIYAVVLNRSAEPVPVSLVTVERGTVETTLNESGIVELGNQQTIKSPTEGAVEQVLVQPGERVRAGQVLITLRYPERQTALGSQQAKIEQQQRIFARNQQKISEAQEQLRADERNLQTLAAGAREGAVARRQVQELEDKVRQTQATLRDAQTDTRTAALEIQALQLERQRIQQELRDTVITAPVDGVVLGIDVKNNDGVELRTDLITIGDPQQELVALQLAALNAAQVKVNQSARVSVIGADAETFSGKVQSLYPQAVVPREEERSQQRSSQSSEPTVPAIVRLDTPTGSLIPGSRVNVEIVLEQRQNVVALDTEVIQRNPEPFVWIRDSQSQAQKRDITLGLEGVLTVEVTSGLRTGEQVIIPPDEDEPQLQPGMPVVPANSPE
ncbi:efflux RND transporter periplasmic adaptor subunit [Gloeocapsopsis sp. IPPAS B-1203]|uniref:efflux RND transporter periplasmic adaptor subunit n=1 Tax=Gloeocapsopsis sp. IPPAS B-1203 TaxID=2049454 RepID=UPI000C199911|nr:efflux RND transporter periplasmic adaptor subunit [Gloeocapsopsis sp. IPPAS B-1203]PIG91057.1 efflux transporter periplasmic adaptor subunit [Gloeocapsopsis sp. IPPAS B-1203]